jgi:signal transduction histidine kinase
VAGIAAPPVNDQAERVRSGLLQYNEALYHEEAALMNEALSADSGDIDAAWDAWRTRALNALLIAACILGWPVMIPAVWGEGGLPPSWRLLGMAAYLLLLLITICPRWSFRVRNWSLVVLAYFAASLALANRGLVGFGRIGLAIYPCWITVLMGPRAGWSAVGLSLGIYGAFAGLTMTGVLRDWGVVMDRPGAPTLWLVQGLALALAMVPCVVLLSHFRAYHMRVLEVERRVSRQLQDEVARRTAAYDSLDREQAERERLEEKIAQLGEEERQHLGREIHDGLCQQLTAALLRCTALQGQLNRRQIAEAAQADRLRLLIKEMLDDAYVISKGIWPVGPEPDDLVPALQAMVKRTSDEFGLICGFRHQGDIAVAGGQTAMHLYRIAQEAVSNSIKHAKAKRVAVLLQGDGDGIELQIRDDGCGPPDATRPRHGMGLSIMMYRARAMGGTLSIGRAEGGGTVVSCHVPGGRTESREGARRGN